jgi:hypothetical protein
MKIESTGRLLDYREFRKYSDTFIETGNAAGDGLQRAIDSGFKTIVGAEASKMYYDICINRFNTNPDVFIENGKSIDVLEQIIKCAANNNLPYVFYLDAHVSGDTSFGYEDWIKNGEESEAAQDRTIKAELNIILKNYNKHVIIIDDVNGLTDGHALEYAELISSFNPDYKFYFYDENLSGDPAFYYHDKLLVAIP